MSKIARWSSGTSESGVKSGVPRQCAVEVVGPAWYGHLKNRSTWPGARIAQARAAVAADVVERAQLTRALRHTITERPATSTTRKSPGSAHLVGHAHRHPGLREDLLALEVEEALLGVGVGDQRRGEVDREARRA